MSTENNVSNIDITYAQKLLRILSEGEPYAPHVMPTARVIAEIRKQITEQILKEIGDRLKYDGKRDNYYIAPYEWGAYTKKCLEPFGVKDL